MSSKDGYDPAESRVQSADLGKRLREARRARGLSLQRLADGAGLSRSFISQVELGQSAPSIGTLKRICAVLDIPIWPLLDDNPAHHGSSAEPLAERRQVDVVRRDQRKVRRYPGTTIDISLLTPDLNRQLEVSLSVLQPGEGYGEEPYTHRGEEFGLVLSGTYEVTVEDTVYVLEEGDSIYFSSRLPHKTRAIGDKPVTTLWVVTPPS